MKLLRAALFLFLAMPAAAQAGPTLVARDVPLAEAQRQLAGVAAPRFTMVGLHWQGSGTVAFRTRSLNGRWSGWRPAAPEDEDRPDRGAAERTVPGWEIGNPYWAGPSDRLDVRTTGRVGRVRAYYVDSQPQSVPPRTLSIAGSPPVISRLAWRANESIRRAAPLYAGNLSFALVHHTAGTNSYTRAESAAIVRGIMVYHVQANGWNDLGYNFLVDRYGQIFEGRYGGIDRNVVGAHAEGFNTGSVGVAVLGNYGGAGITAAARDSLVRLLAWRLDVGHVDPLSTLTSPSGGNARYPSGVPVFLRAVSGHRDTGFTECPGDALYAYLAQLAGGIGQTGLPKLYAPAIRGGIGGPVRFTARLSAALPWTVAVTDSAGNRIAGGGGTGTAVDWTWDATAAAHGTYAWTMEAGPAVLPARGTVGAKPAALAIANAAAVPAVVSPNADGFDDTGLVTFRLTAPATVTATLVDAAGNTVATVGTGQRTAGEQRLSVAVDGVPDGLYTVVLRARGATSEVTARVPVAVNRTLGYVKASQRVFSPNGDGRLDTIDLGFLLLRPARVRVRVLRGGKWVANVFRGTLSDGGQTIPWDGKKAHGRLRDGDYEAEVIATNELGSVSQRAPFSVDTTAPSLRLYSVQPLRVRVLEPVRLAIQVNGKWTTIDRKRPGLVPIPRPEVLRKLRIVARDAAGNASAPLTYRR
jgi:N-acetylmuramoyl-L-alanine amidase